MKDNLRSLLKAFMENKEVLRKAGWEVCEENSPKWWKGVETEEELIISAILVQLSKWETVTEALRNLRENGLANLRALLTVNADDLAEKIKPVGLRRIKARRLKTLAEVLAKRGCLDSLRTLNTEKIREILLAIEGVGEETADAITLFTLHKPTFPVSKYVRTVLTRLGIIEGNESYDKIRRMILEELNSNVNDLKLLYAGLTTVGRLFCRKKPKCDVCILRRTCKFNKSLK